MFVVINELFVAQANEPVFERNFAASMHGTLTGVPGLTAARLLRPRQDGRGYLSVLEFTDEAAYSAFLESEAFTAAHHWPDHAPIDSSRLTTYETVTRV
ncbi:antibiotic biosynthesis monooxygenase family protein [Nocardia acidivorans]|uniref:antibiotic biosynthesis monooxygenase family protein n=1 Tax=Nocardia acidivorans TaxID=404580 RepID=UPI000835A4FC|nr:antibiotic biosynthesis monooxygenase [Nocardia acidivorans]